LLFRKHPHLSWLDMSYNRIKGELDLTNVPLSMAFAGFAGNIFTDLTLGHVSALQNAKEGLMLRMEKNDLKQVTFGSHYPGLELFIYQNPVSSSKLLESMKRHSFRHLVVLSNLEKEVERFKKERNMLDWVLTCTRSIYTARKAYSY